MSQKRRITLLPQRRSGDPRASALALVLQLLVLGVVVPALLVPVAYDFFTDDAGRAVVPERISFQVALPTQGPPERRPAQDGGDNRPMVEDPTPAPAPAPVVAPSAVPSGLPAAPATPPANAGGYGPLVGGGGPTEGIRPSFTDQRLWVKHSDAVVAPIVPMTRADTLQQLLQRGIIAYSDSLARVNPAGRRPGDWTFDVGDKKYGIDGQMIRLGDFSLPTAALAMLPLNVQANPVAVERARRLESFRQEIQTQAVRAMRDDAFYEAVRALRERKEKERREAEEAATRTRTPDRD